MAGDVHSEATSGWTRRYGVVAFRVDMFYLERG
jgi:hypothetical protein